MDPKVWGTHGWFFLYAVMLTYPDNPKEEDKINMKNFINSVGKVLPCTKCRGNFAKHLKKFPVSEETLSTRKQLVIWLVNVHNEVNVMTGKNKMTYDEAINKFIKQTKPDSGGGNNFIMILLLLIFFLVLVIIFMKLIE